VPFAPLFLSPAACPSIACAASGAGNKSDSESLAAVAAVVTEHLAEIKALSPNVKVNRFVCGSCLDFKLLITQDLDDYGPWAESDHKPEGNFVKKISAIEGISAVEVQTITNMEI